MFIFQAEDGIRVIGVTGVQTCALPICSGKVQVVTRRAEAPSPFAAGLLFGFTAAFMYQYDRVEAEPGGAPPLDRQLLEQRSEERRVGKECRSRRAPYPRTRESRTSSTW